MVRTAAFTSNKTWRTGRETRYWHVMTWQLLISSDEFPRNQVYKKTVIGNWTEHSRITILVMN